MDLFIGFVFLVFLCFPAGVDSKKKSAFQWKSRIRSFSYQLKLVPARTNLYNDLVFSFFNHLDALLPSQEFLSVVDLFVVFFESDTNPSELGKANLCLCIHREGHIQRNVPVRFCPSTGDYSSRGVNRSSHIPQVADHLRLDQNVLES